ncbi:LSU ribosomal protein L17p [hydrothermal vent metagenome]|uniref:LSU ribosomal protein L17p n=1 Tax=hydrothermal vent metagenome TaxID=652676 RepID=A0A3B1D541_9ZZZZ
MRHRVHKKNFGRNTLQRKALFRNLMVSLFMHERIETTVTKAKVIKSLAEKVVTLGKKGDLHSKRMALSYVPNRAAIAKLFSEIAPRFSKRNGGYLRVVKTRVRLKDQAPLAVIEFVDYQERQAEKKTETEGKKS